MMCAPTRGPRCAAADPASLAQLLTLGRMMHVQRSLLSVNLRAARLRTQIPALSLSGLVKGPDTLKSSQPLASLGQLPRSGVTFPSKNHQSHWLALTSTLHRCLSTTTTTVTADEHCQVSIEPSRKLLTLDQAKGQRLSFNASWLRYNCQCPECVQEGSGNSLLDPCEMYPTYSIQGAQIEGDQVKLTWAEDGHQGFIPIAHLQEHDYSDEGRQQYYEERTPPVVKNNEVPTVTYKEVTESEKGIYSWIQKLNDYGVCLLTGVPCERGNVAKAAEFIWPVKHTIYGKIFDVESTPTPINVAYSSVGITYHIDLNYYESPPGIQLLHCIRYDSCVQGGESLIVDGWAVAEQMRTEHPQDFEVLTRVPTTFQKIHSARDKPVWMRYQRKHIELSDNGNIRGIHWSPPWQAPLKVPEEDVEPYYKACHQFAQLMKTSPSKLEFTMKAGDLISFNNRRVFHARKEFELNGGSRLLQGCYLNIDEFKSRVEVLSHKYNNGRPAKRVFNHDLL